MIIPETVQIKVIEILTSKIQKEVRISYVQPLSGGDINSAAKIETNQGNYFLKWNYADKYPKMFDQEAKGLNILNLADCIRIPQVIASDYAGEFAFLLLEFVEEGKAKTQFWEEFGKSLAGLHKNTHKYFGLDHDNFIGSLTQSNQTHKNWDSFFIEERIQPQLKKAFDSKLINSAVLMTAEQLFKRLNEIFPNEAPALLHGDLWSGNFMIDHSGIPCLFDPAVYYGFREMDIAMSKLFGGFSHYFYQSYNRFYPMENGWEERLDICNLYPLLVHVNLFGISYVGQVKSILQRF